MFKYLKQISAAVALTVAISGTTATTADAAFVTIDEAGMNAVYSQSTFGTSPIRILIGAVTEIVAPSLLDIQNDGQISALFNMHQGPLNEVNFFFVDVVDSCSGFNVNIVGCGEFPGNDFVVESQFAATSANAELLAHELGHNLGLDHRAGGLMDPTINGDTDLTLAEVAQIFNSPLVQSDQDGFFIRINPILVTAQAVVPVPLPAAGLLMIGALGGLGLTRRKRRAA